MTSRSVFRDFETKVYHYWFHGILHVEMLLGGIPNNPKVAEAWIRSKIEADEDTIARMVAENMLERGVTKEEAIQLVNDNRNLNGFKRDDKNGLYIEGRQLKAAIKEAVSVAVGAENLEQRGWGVTRKFLTKYVPEHIFVEETRLYVGRKKADDVHQQFVHSRFGSSISNSEYVKDVDIDFTVVTDHDFTNDEWATIWVTGQRQGIGAGRSMGWGTYEVTRWDKTDYRKTPKKATPGTTSRKSRSLS